MTDNVDNADGKPRNIRIKVDGGSITAVSEGLGFRVKGPTRDGIHVSDRDGTAAVDIEHGKVTRASTTGAPSTNEDGSLATGRILVRRLKQDGATWGEPYTVEARVGGGVDCEAKDKNDPRRRLKIQVTRADIDEEFWKQLGRRKQAQLPPSAVDDVVDRVWNAVLNKRLYAQPDELLALNAIRTPWAVSQLVVDTFRQRYGQQTRLIGFREVWAVGWSEGLTERLDT